MFILPIRHPITVLQAIGIVAVLGQPIASSAGTDPTLRGAAVPETTANQPVNSHAAGPQLMSWTTIVMASIEKHSGPAPLALNLRIAEAESKNRRNRLIGWSLAGTGLAVGGLVVAGQQYKLFPISALCFLGASMFFVRSKGRAMVASDVASESERMDAIQ